MYNNEYNHFITYHLSQVQAILLYLICVLTIDLGDIVNQSLKHVPYKEIFLQAKYSSFGV